MTEFTDKKRHSLTIIDTLGVLNHKVQSGIEPDRFMFNYDEDRANQELEELEQIEKDLHIKI